MSPGLKRAREPYRLRNAITGLALGLFSVGVWAWSISAVKQDQFDDIDDEARELIKSREQASSSASTSGTSNKEVVGGSGVGTGTTGVVRIGSGATGADSARSTSREDDAVLDAVSVVVSPPIPLPPPTSEPVNGGPTIITPPRGILQHLDARFPRLLDPKTKTVVWGAPPLDNIGKLSDRTS
ncbi:hypothetical protein AX16_007268 [Volvariella volvacea WC 439]|nr:hypothetical protein AX16_007268 [Volvariella volvacea WC 439]